MPFKKGKSGKTVGRLILGKLQLRKPFNCFNLVI